MKIKIISLTALTALAFAGAALAQDPTNDGERGRGRRGGMRHDPMERLTESLNLTADQKTKIQPILDEAKPKMDQIRREAMEKSKTVMDDAEAKIRPLLTAEQQKKLDEEKNNRRGGQGRRGRHGDGGDQDEG